MYRTTSTPKLRMTSHVSRFNVSPGASRSRAPHKPAVKLPPPAKPQQNQYLRIIAARLPRLVLRLALCLLVPTVAQANICSRTAQVQTAIIAEVPGNKACADITNTDLAGITTFLHVTHDSTLTALKSGDFAGLTNLTQLNLRHNSKLSSLPADIFDPLTSLTTLNLNDNDLSSLPAGVFDALTSLTTLRLQDNSLSSLPADIFDSLTSLTTLHLNNNSLSSLPADIFDTLTSLTFLDMSYNSLTGSGLPADIFDNLDSLTSLLIMGNDSLTSLPAGIFDELDTLTYLALLDNSLSSLPANIFDNLTSLNHLLLGNNELSSLPAGIFDNLGNLTRLWLHNNSLTSLPTGVLNNLGNLTRLRLDNNPLSGPLSGTIPALSTTLQRLHLAGNPITGWPSNLSSLTNLTELSLCGTSLTTSATLPAALETRRTNGDLTVFSCLNIADATATEGTALSFAVEHSTWPVRGSASAEALTVSYATADGTATSADYTGTAAGSLTIPANTNTTTWTSSATISVSTTDDTVVEPDETFTVSLGSASNVIEVRQTATGTITDNDGALSIADASVTEGIDKGGLATFTVSLNRALSQQVTVNYATANRTATAPGDYTATSGTLTFAAGETSKTITVPVVDDTIDERNETFSVTLSNPTNAVLSTTATTATGTITDNDAAPTLSLADTSVIEGNSGESIITFTLSLSHLSSKAVAVDVKTSNGTAIAGSDYVAQNDTLFGLGNSTTATIYVKVKGDTAEEVDETFTVTLSNPTNASLSATAKTATGTIRNDDTTLSIAATSVVEGNSGPTTANFPVRLSRASAKPVTVRYATADGTATAPGDYTATSGTLTFAAGDTSKTIPVTVQGDSVVEPDETFTLTLSNAANARLSTATATGTITNDDEAPLVPPGGGDGGGGGGGAATDQHGNTPATATAIAMGSSTPGQINSPTDVDYFTFSVPQAGLLVIETTGSTNTQGRLTTSDGQVLVQAETGGTRQNFQVTRRVPPGTYLVAVSGTGTGSYRLEVDLFVGHLENPRPDSPQSGLGVLSGWLCAVDSVVFEIEMDPDQESWAAATGTLRPDTASECNGIGRYRLRPALQLEPPGRRRPYRATGAQRH